MKKIFLFFVLMCSFVFAKECTYQVDYIEDNGSFTTIECFDNFDDAQNKMESLGGDYVVRNMKSLSPSKIISMNQGLAYTYSFRSGSSIQNIYSELNDSHEGSGATTYLTAHYEMTYHKTEYVHEFKSGYVGGWIKVTMNGFTGYADLEYVDLVPEKFIREGIPIELGGVNNSKYYEETVQVICRQNYYEAVKNGNYTDLVFHFYRAWPSKDKEPLHSSLTIGVAPDFMKEGERYYSNDGINFFNDRELKELAGTYYNYYQFLPVRTKTLISADVLNKYINEKSPKNSILVGHGEDFIENQNKYGVNAVTILSMAIHESGWGTSNIARNKNNLFGWGAFDDATTNATSYPSVSSCIEAQMGDNLANYLDTSSSLFFSMSLGNKGGGFITKYASDPYWAEKISKYYYDIDKYANNYDGNLTDYNSVKIALVKNKTNITSEKGDIALHHRTGYFKNVIVPFVDTDNYLVQTPNPIDGEIIFPIKFPIGTLAEYNWEKSVGTIRNEEIQFLNYKQEIVETPTETIEAEGKAYHSISAMAIEDGNLKIEGTAFFTGVNFNDNEKVLHEIQIRKWQSKEVVKSVIVENTEFNFSLNDGFEYKYIGFKGQVDLSDLPVGDYYLSVKTSSENYYKEQKLTSSNIKFSNMSTLIENGENKYAISIATSSMEGYAILLNVLSTPIDYSIIEKPEVRDSMFVFEDISFAEEEERVYMNIKAHAMIYYLDYDNLSGLKYTAFLIKDENDFLEATATNYACPINYSEHLKSSYKMDNICFDVKFDVTDLQGEYSMVLKIENEEYSDVVDMIIPTKVFEAFQKGEKTYSVSKTEIRDKAVFFAE